VLITFGFSLVGVELRVTTLDTVFLLRNPGREEVIVLILLGRIVVTRPSLVFGRSIDLIVFNGLFVILEVSEVTTFTSPAVVRGDESVTDRGDPSLMGRGDASDTVRVEDRGVGKEVNGLLNEEIGGLRVGRELGGLRERAPVFRLR